MTMRIELVEVHGEEAIRQKINLDSFPITLGRGTSEAVGFVPLPNCGGAYLSKLHCTIFNRGQALFLADGDPDGRPSHNGIWLDGKLIQKPVLLHPGQIFTLLKPPPCEIQIHVLPEAEAEQDTLTPALRQLIEKPDGEAIERLSLAVNSLRRDAEKNKRLDELLRADVARLRAEKGSLLTQLEEARTEFSAFSASISAWRTAQNRSMKRLVRLLSGTMLAVAILSAVVMAGDEKRQASLIDIGIAIALGLVGTGGFAMTNNRNTLSNDSYSNRGDAGAQEIPQRL